MIAVLQRVTKAAVAVDGETVGSCAHGLLILLGVSVEDSEEDCRLLAEKILRRINAEFKRENPLFDDKYFCETTKDFMVDYPWPGNVRQLKNVTEQISVIETHREINGDILQHRTVG